MVYASLYAAHPRVTTTVRRPPWSTRLRSDPTGGHRCRRRCVAGGLPRLAVNGADWYLPLPGGIYHGHGSGRPVKLANPCPQYPNNPETPAVAVADPQHLDAMCASGGAGGSAAYQLYGTTDSGRHWRKAGPSRREASGLYGLADNAHGVLLVATASGGSEILRSTDDGATLTNAAIKTPSGGIGWSDLGFTTSTHAVAVLQHTALYLSRDAGRSWTSAHF